MFDIELYVHKTSVGISIKNKSKSEASFFIKEFFINFSEITNKGMDYFGNIPLNALSG